MRLNEQLQTQLAELQASRLRIVHAEDAERRRMERDLREGAQQQLLQIAEKLDLARSVAGQDEQCERQLVSDLRAQTRATLAALRALAHGINRRC